MKMKIKMFTCICDNVGETPYRITTSANSISDFKKKCRGNGELLNIKEVETAISNQEEFMNRLEEVLKNNLYGENEIKHIKAIINANY